MPILHPLITLIIALFFILLGSITALIPWSATIRTQLVTFILENSIALFLFGFSFIIIGIALIAHTIHQSKRKYYRIKSGKNPIQLSETVIQDYLNTYWKQLFPDKEIPSRLVLKSEKVLIQADLPYLPLEEQKPLLQKIEGDLLDLFRGVLGYREALDISISFNSKR